MLKKLQWKIVAINMALVALVLICAFSAMAALSYQSARAQLWQGLRRAVELRDGERLFGRIGGPGISAEDAPDSVSSVTVFVDADGRILTTVQNGATIDEDTLARAVEAALAEGAEGKMGVLPEFALAYVRQKTPMGTSLAFASSDSLSATLRQGVLRSAGFLAASLAVFFFVSLWLSRYAVRPIETAWKQQKRFVADASHELKTPLTVILANLNILAAHPDDTLSRQRQWLESTDEEAKHMRALIDQMLQLSRSEAEQTPVAMADVNASDLVEEYLLYFEAVAYEKGVELRAEIEAGVTLRADPMMLRQIAQILLDNAVKYAPERSAVTVGLRRRGAGLELRVNNRGEPIPPEELAHIFDRFYRLDKARGSGGYGLGLAIAKSLCERLKGDLRAESDAREGTTFTLNLPGRDIV